MIATTLRNEKGNELWRAVNRVNRIGRNIFKNTDPARANDYKA
jgi:hypothetical protein